MMMLNLLAYVSNGLENRQYCAEVICNVSKNFDGMSPDLLLHKLERYRFSGIASQIISSYLYKSKSNLVVYRIYKRSGVQYDPTDLNMY